MQDVLAYPQAGVHQLAAGGLGREHYEEVEVRVGEVGALGVGAHEFEFRLYPVLVQVCADEIHQVSGDRIDALGLLRGGAYPLQYLLFQAHFFPSGMSGAQWGIQRSSG